MSDRERWYSKRRRCHLKLFTSCNAVLFPTLNSTFYLTHYISVSDKMFVKIHATIHMVTPIPRLTINILIYAIVFRPKHVYFKLQYWFSLQNGNTQTAQWIVLSSAHTIQSGIIWSSVPKKWCSCQNSTFQQVFITFIFIWKKNWANSITLTLTMSGVIQD
jgi:hypothetical protein